MKIITIKYRRTSAMQMMHVAVALLLILPTACGNKQASESKEPTDTLVSIPASRLARVGVELAAPQYRDMHVNLNVPGKVAVLSQDQASVTARIAGSVESVFVKEGQPVSKGQKLLSLNSQAFVQLQEQYLEAAAELDYLQQDLERQRELRKSKVIAEKDFQLAQSKFEGTRARVNAAEARLRILSIDTRELKQSGKIRSSFELFAPVGGYLVKLPVSLGMSVLPETELAHIINVDHFHADLFVPEKDILHVHDGQDVWLNFANNSILPVKGEVEFISHEIDAVRRSVVVHVIFDPGKQPIFPDMTLRGTFIGKSTKTLAVPNSAIVHNGGETYLYIAVPGKEASYAFIRKNVQVLFSEDSWSAIEEQMDTTGKVVSKGAMLVEGELKKAQMGEIED